MMGRKVPMQFDSEQGCWYVELQGSNYGFHCGEHVKLYMGGQPVVCRFELDLDWYVILKDARNGGFLRAAQVRLRRTNSVPGSHFDPSSLEMCHTHSAVHRPSVQYRERI